MTKDPNISTEADLQIPVMTALTRCTASWRSTASAAVGSRKRQNSTISAGRGLLSNLLQRDMADIVHQGHHGLTSATHLHSERTRPAPARPALYPLQTLTR